MEIAKLLPTEPPQELVDWTVENHGREELGGEFCVFISERLPVLPRFEEIVERNSFAPIRKEWGAVCNCTACSEEFVTQKEPGMDAIRLINSEDGWNYTLDIGDPVDPYMGIQVHRKNDHFLCPLCGSEVKLIHARNLRGGRTKRLLVVEARTMDQYLCLVYWLVYRKLSEFGISDYGATPNNAFVLTETGKLVKFRYDTDRWITMRDNAEAFDMIYHDWGSICNKKRGGVIYPVVPDLEGTTGEKTALAEFIQAGGYAPVAYLKLWRHRPGIENLSRQGQSSLVVSICNTAWRYSYDAKAEAGKYLDLTKRKPHEMLRMTKEEFRYLRGHGIGLTVESLELWQKYRAASGTATMEQYMAFKSIAGDSGMRAAIDLIRAYGDGDLDKISRYLDKQHLGLNETGILLDTRNAFRSLYNRPLTAEELWPRQLHAVHDRIHQMLSLSKDREKDRKYAERFQKIVDILGTTEWTDGNLCVILPRNATDLVREGEILRHCVGSYVGMHAKGERVIFFVRHYRRPERPYYTLCIDMKGVPKEDQLHGYGNEHHGPHKEYHHKIPKKVRAFVDRWKREVLLEWYAQKLKGDKST